MDMCSKVFISVIIQCAFKILNKHGNRYQFGGTPYLGTRDELFTVITLLHLHHQHNLPTYVAYIDLAKAYDTANHKLLTKLLKLYGAPPKFANATERMYQDLMVIIKIGKETAEIEQTVSVR